ncbi:NADPH-dependent FMN reductase [Magnetovibrio sp. PR-2]|uniref:NADPH-dependent FMN reductase n=1 Tax=Magnetovibrio sp. PR-2 TaxID=3120356 RepID=UPI002FCE1A44
MSTSLNIVAFAATTSSKSVNKQLATYAAGLVEGASVEVLDLNDFELPLFSEDREAELGQPQLAHDFLAKLSGADAVVISFAEHNGSYAAAFKSLFDWASRITRDVYANKPMVLLATSPGPGGAKTVLAQAEGSMGFFAGDVKATLSVPSFYDNFDVEAQEMTNAELKAQLVDAMSTLKTAVAQAA